MTKISFFVEGQTERIFLEKFLSEYFGIIKVTIKSNKLIGDKTHQIRARKINSNTEVYVLIYEVMNGDKVVSEVLDRAERMIKVGYRQLLALRDLYPKKIEEKDRIINATLKEFNKSQFADKLKHILAIMEIEAWFLADYKLFEKIDKRLTTQFINHNSGLDLMNTDPETYPHPAKIIDTILKIVGKSYKKHEEQSYNIIHNINYEFLYCGGVSNKIKSFFYFLKCIDEGIASN
ncbi:MAG: DUF4276 family protein [bacterium]